MCDCLCCLSVVVCLFAGVMSMFMFVVCLVCECFLLSLVCAVCVRSFIVVVLCVCFMCLVWSFVCCACLFMCLL